MNELKKFFRLPLALDAARDRVEFDLRGEFLYLDRNTDGTLSVHLDYSNADPYPLSAQDGLAVPFVKIFITHTAQAGKVANLWYGEDVRILQALSTVALTLSKGATISVSSATAGAASGLVLAPNTARRRVSMKNTHATDTAYWCEDATAATMAKYFIGPGEEQEIESTDGINAIRGGANDITLLFREERD